MLDDLNRLLSPLRRRIANIVARAVVSVVIDSTKMQGAQLSIAADETREGCERFQNYGFTSVPFAGAEAVVVFVGGLRDHPLVVAVDDRRYRKKNLQPGEVAIYDDQGNYVLVKRGNVIELNAATKVLVTSPLLDATGDVNAAAGHGYKVNGTQVVGAQGAAVADSTAVVASVSTQLNLLLARCRAHGLIG